MNSKVILYSFSVLSGGRDGKINIMDRALNVVMTIDMNEKEFGSISPGVRSLKFDPSESNLLVGTYGSEIYELAVDLAAQSVGSSKLLNQGHYSPAKKVMNYFH